MFKHLVLLLSLLFLLLIPNIFAQIPKDSAVTSNPGRLSFEIFVGMNSSNILNKGLSDQEKENELGYTRTNLTVNDHTGYFFSTENEQNEKLRKLPTIKIALIVKNNKNLSTVIGVRYFYNTLGLRYTSDYYSKPSSRLESRSGANLNSKTDNFQVIIGSQLNFKNFFFSASVNPTLLVMTQDVWGGGSTLYPYGWYGNDEYGTGAISVYQVCLGAGANVGYEFPIKQHAIKLELFCDYNPRLVNLRGLGDYWVHTLNSGILVGFKLGGKKHLTAEVTEEKEIALAKKKNKKLSFEILAGINSSKLLNKGYIEKRESGPAPYDYSISTLTLAHGVTRMPTVKVALDYNFNKFLKTSLGLKYFYNKISLDYYIHSYTNQSSDDQSDTFSHLGAGTNNLQFSIGPKGAYKNLSVSASLNPTLLFINQKINGVTQTKTSGYWSYDQYDPSSVKTLQFCWGTGASVGYELPLKWQTLKFELSCDYLSRSVTLYSLGNYKLNSLNTSLLVGFKF